MSEETTKQLISRLAKLIAIDTRSTKDNTPLITLLTEWFTTYDCRIQEWVRPDGVKGKNLIVKIPGENHEKSLVFICHMDTVPPSSAWETDPFILEEQEGKLYGLGTCDTKGGVASLIQAVFSLKKTPAVDTYLVFDGDEESTWSGAKMFQKHYNLPNPSFIAIEPTDKTLCIGARSILECTITTQGTSIHASFGTPQLNEKESAIYKMSNILTALIKDAKESALEQDRIMGSNSQNLGIISGGTARNVVPDSCLLSLDRRILPNKDIQEEFMRVKKCILAADPRAMVENAFLEKGFQAEEKNQFVQDLFAKAKKFLSDIKMGSFQAMSEVTIFQDEGDCVVLGPGSISLAHKANEYVDAQELFIYVDLYREIIENIYK